MTIINKSALLWPWESETARHGCRRSWILICACFMVSLLPCATAADKNSEDEMRWEDAEREVGNERIPSAFYDSLRTLYNIGDDRSLRQCGPPPFTVKEKYVYDGGWGFIKAGFAILGAEYAANDPQTLLISGKVVTNNFVSAFYRVRDYVLSVNDSRGIYPFSFEQHVQEGRYRAKRWTIFDQKNGFVYDHRKDSAYVITPFTADYISVLFYLRTLPLAPGDTFSLHCFVHAKDYPIFFKVGTEREKVKSEAGTFSCLVVEPRLVGEGRGFTRRDKMTLWLTDDRYHMLVMVRAKAAIGSLTARLLHFERR
jgi:hypothetical protein